jgi:phage repressor protein C with HTH and peptisase S24 domain
MLEAASTRPDQAAWLPIDSTDMAPAINFGSQVLINTGEIGPVDGKVFALAWRDQLLIRRIYMTPKGYRLALDANPAAAIELTEAEFRSQVTVAGRIRGAVTIYE